MASAVRTCPACDTQVLPNSVDVCPACGRHNFATGETAPAVGVPRPPVQALTMGAAARLYRRLVICLGLEVFAFLWLPPFGRVEWFVVAALLVANLMVILRTVHALAGWLGLSPLGFELGMLVPIVNLFLLTGLVVKSHDYFRARGVRFGILGPLLADVAELEARGGRPTSA